jgi:hypothetical protein
MKQEPKNDLFFNCRTKSKQLSKKELANAAPALVYNVQINHCIFTVQTLEKHQRYKLRFICSSLSLYYLVFELFPNFQPIHWNGRVLTIKKKHYLNA